MKVLGMISNMNALFYNFPDNQIMKAQNNYKLASALAFCGVLLLAVGYQFYTSQSTPTLSEASFIPRIDYQFDVYCPVDSADRLKQINTALGFSNSALDFNFKVNEQVYVVIAKTQPEDSQDPDSPGKLFYCGFARKWTESTCQNARLVCSIPGPMFYFPARQEATIMFINDINTETVNWIQSDCYDPDSDEEFCTVSTKQGSCSYFQPTDYAGKTGTHRIGKQSIPIAPHIHGLEVRPTFDGNSLSWFNTQGDKGPGYNTLLNENYYNQFNHPITFKGKKKIDSSLANRMKVIQVTNDQLPGMLFYHDHAMKSTLYNVQNGFVGVYIIYDKKVEAILPSGDRQKFILLAKPGDSRAFVSPSDDGNNGNTLDKGYYRLRLLNAHYDNVYYNISFSAYYSSVRDIQGRTTYIEYDPSSSPDYDLTEHQHRIPFSVIGTDTTIFDRPVHDIDLIKSLGAAERVDMLINFKAHLPPGVQFIYLVVVDDNQGKYVIKHRFTLPWVEEREEQTVALQQIQQQEDLQNIETYQEEQAQLDYISDPDYVRKLKLNVPFTDLSQVPESQIVTRRHRPLFSLPRDSKFMIGAHYMFEMGASQISQIGTIQDFYIVNTLWQPHPMHVHLVNFQVVASYSLKAIPQNPDCTLYMLDFFRLSNLSQLQLNNKDLCNYLWALDDEQTLDLFTKLQSYMLENDTLTHQKKDSGLDTMTSYDGDQRYWVRGCEWNLKYKYVCGNSTKNIETYQRRWKDTVLVPAYTVSILRVRWASTGYDAKKRSFPYFNVPEDQLLEFPGYIYHCHILPHQDNEMMRPIMLTHSDQYLKRFKWIKKRTSCSSKTWVQSMKCINKKTGCPA